MGTREEKTIMSSSNDAGNIADKAGVFMTANNLSDVTKNYPDNLIMPKE